MDGWSNSSRREDNFSIRSVGETVLIKESASSGLKIGLQTNLIFPPRSAKLEKALGMMESIPLEKKPTARS
jgi:hypothetical protein